MMKIPKIAIVISHPIQHFCPQYVSYAKSTNWEIKVFFASTLGLNAYNDKSFGQIITWNNLNIEKFPHIFLNHGETIQVDSNIDAPELEDELKNFEPDVVVIYGYYQKYQKRAYSWATKNGKKIFYISDSENRKRRFPLLKGIKAFYLRNYFKKIDAFLTVGDANEEYYQFYGVNSARFYRTSFPIDLGLYESCFSTKEELRRNCRKELGLSENDIVCSVVGKVIQYKSQEHIIEALTNIDKSLTLLIVGAGPDENILKAKASKIKNHKIIFTGFVDPMNLPKYYAATDIYIHSSQKDAHSLSISEAIFMGLPVIVSNTCGSWGTTDDVQPGKNGFVYQWGNINQLEEYICKLLNSKYLLSNFSRHSITISRQFQQASHEGGLKSALICNNLL